MSANRLGSFSSAAFSVGFSGRLYAVAHRREHDPLTVGRVGRLGVVALCGGQARQRAGLLVEREDVHLRVVVPRVASLLARGAERQFLVLVLLRPGIEVGGGEEHLVAVRPEECAGGLPDPRGDPFDVACRQIEREDLVPGVGRVAFALKDHALAIRREIPFAGASALHGEPADPREEIALLVSRRRRLC